MTERVKRILSDPNHVAWYGELLGSLTFEEVEEIWRAVQSESLLAWAHEMRQKSPLRIATRKKGIGYVYVMKDRRNGRLKIGFSKNPRIRESTLQSENPDIVLLWSWVGTKQQEKRLHERFKSKRIRGEWFELTEAEIRAELAL